MSETIIFNAPEPGRRRRFTVQQKRTLLEAAQAPGASISSVARQHGLHASMLFQWRHAMANGEEKGLESGEDLVPASKLKEAETRIRELERALGRKTMENEILHEAVRIGREKKLISPAKLRKLDGGK
jgi:transposase